ncbi:leucine-rich repeat extensin-like protein 1 isoform X2 [Sipha flava]|uniref:Leucine-rich repeat extensin-like protein 1 isoform X2 n=1 Tax=Sipha flava TaxID=143950 RepID=A0A8B8F9D5_9HEMI|nr:leucine-rich repeat extensin-like protein 1 isoform X2 [Sipha flava]
MMIKIFTFLVVVVSGILCSGSQQGVSNTQTGQSLQVQPNVRKYNKHTSTESSTTGTRKDKPENSDVQDYVQIGGAPAGPGYPYPYPYPYQPVGPTPGGVVLVQPGGNPYRVQYPYEAQYPVDGTQYYGSYYPTVPSPQPLPPYAPYHSAAYPAPMQPLQQYEQAIVVDAYRGPLTPYPQPIAEQFYRQPAAAPFASSPYHYGPQQPSPPHFRAHAYGRPPMPPAFIQQRDVTGATANVAASASSPSANSAANNAESQYEQQQSGPFDGNQYNF